MTTYQPSGPYVIQSGKRAGKVLELLMLTDYSFLTWMLKKLNQVARSGKNELHLHLEWLLQKGENRQSKMICPQCGRETVRFFSVRYAGDLFSIGPSYTCCGNRGCIEKLRALAAGKDPEFLTFRFSIMKNFRLKTDQQRVGRLFRTIFQLPDPLSRQGVFDFFNS